MKRTFDLTLAVAGLIMSLPILAVAVAAIRLTSPGQSLFLQKRIGLAEREFTCIKLRTMYIETGSRASHEVSRDAITPLGHFLRRTKMDELPQLWNIIRGEMSFVGPRPCLPTQSELIAARRNRGLYAIRPGITGISQVQGVDMSEPDRLAALDAAYLDDMSLKTDIRLILATVTGSGQGDAVKD